MLQAVIIRNIMLICIKINRNDIKKPQDKTCGFFLFVLLNIGKGVIIYKII